MKKTILIVALVAILAVALGVFSVGAAFAQDGTPPFGGHGPMMQNGGTGVLHTFMTTEFAKKLDLNVNDVNTRLAAGETMWSIAQAQGLSDEEISDLMLAARDEALNAAVEAGDLTQEQADWMSQHMQQMQAYGIGAGGCGGGFRQGAAQSGWQRMPMRRWFNQP